jgi:adenosylcobyric acid synthase
MSLLESDEPKFVKFDEEHNSFRDKSFQTGASTMRKEARTKKEKSPKKAVDCIADDKSIPRRVVEGCKSIAVLGTMSDAGKSVVTAGLCRILSNGGMRVAPFKGQNMSNNASPALLPDHSRREKLYKSLQKAAGPKVKLPTSPNGPVDLGYGEIGTAQSLQAEACRIVPRVEMNPVPLKSGGRNRKGEHLCSVVVLGKQIARETFGDLGKRTTSLRTMVLDSHEALAEATGAEVIVLEGAGSCTELNFNDRDIVNLPLVRALNCPWLLVANIDPGGVFAQIVGTKMCVSEHDWSLCVGVIVNQLKGEAKYFEPGPKMIEVSVGCVGVRFVYFCA